MRSRPGSRIPQRVCWSRAQDRATAKGARNFLTALTLGAGSASEGAETGLGAMQSVERDGERAALFNSKTNGDAFWAGIRGSPKQWANTPTSKKSSTESPGATIAYAQQPRQISARRSGAAVRSEHPDRVPATQQRCPRLRHGQHFGLPSGNDGKLHARGASHGRRRRDPTNRVQGDVAARRRTGSHIQFRLPDRRQRHPRSACACAA